MDAPSATGPAAPVVKWAALSPGAPILNPHTEFYRLHFLVPPFGWWLHTNHTSVRRHLPSGPVRSVLEVGGGLGRLAYVLGRRYPDASVLSIDISDEMHRISSKNVRLPNVRFERVDFLDCAGRFDLIVSAGCWEFLPLDKSAGKVASLLEPGGALVINTLRPTLFAMAHARLYQHRYHAPITLHDPDALVGALHARGLSAEWTGVNRVEGSYTLTARR